MQIDDFIERYPRLYHMAEARTWPSIARYGLLSTSAILDLHHLEGPARLDFESRHRPEMMRVDSTHAPSTMLRDQKPMSDVRLVMALDGSCTPQEWYELLNHKVFMWATHPRLITLHSARHYRNMEHDVLTIDTAAFLARYSDVVELCHMNSGNTFPIPHQRTSAVFQKIRDYPVKPSGLPVREVAEVTVPQAIPDICDFIVAVDSYRGAELVANIYER